MKKTYTINQDTVIKLKVRLEIFKQYFISGQVWIDLKVIFHAILFKVWAFRKSIYLAILFLFLLFGVPRLQNLVLNISAGRLKDQLAEEKFMQSYINDLQRGTDRLKHKFTALTPRSTYLVINSTGNEFFLYKNRELFRKGKCSTGSYILLKNEEKQEWVFKTPKGIFSIKGKITNPVWKKPDWAFVEEGLPVPPINDPSRYEYGVLGDYALSLGDGYMLHGTLYKRFIGLPVTHGCVRLGDEDLEIIYKSLSVGSKVIIY